MSFIATLNDILVEESGKIGDDIFQRSLHTSPWTDLPELAEWPEEFGEEVAVMVYGRSLPASPPTWKKVSGVDNSGAGKTVIPPSQTLAFGEVLRTYFLEHTALESPKLNINDLRSAVKRAEQMAAIKNILVQNTDNLWINRNRALYISIAGHKVVLDSLLSEDPTNFPTPTGSSGTTTGSVGMLTNVVLDKFYRRLLRMSSQKYAMDHVDGRPIYTLVTESATSEYLKREAGIREDIHFAGRAPELLAPLGVSRPYKNFYHLVDEFAPRYTAATSGGVTTWTEVPPYVFDTGSLSTQILIENPAFETAPYTDSIIFVRAAYQICIPNPGLAGGAGATFDPVSYRGDWRWLNVPNLDTTSDAYNPDGSWGIFRGNFASGAKSVFPEFAIVIRHLRNEAPLTLVTGNTQVS